MKRAFPLLLIVLITAFASFPALGGDEPSPGAQELDRIRREMRKKKTEISQENRKERSVLAALEKIDRAIQEGADELLGQQKKLQDAESALQHNQESCMQLDRELERQKQAYGMRLRALYKMRRSGMVPVSGAAGVEGLAKETRYLAVIAERDRAVIEDYRNALKLLVREQEEIAGKKSEILGRQRDVEVKKNEQESRRRQKAMLLGNVRQKKSLSEQAYRELEESSASLWSMIRRDEEERRSAKEPLDTIRSLSRNVPGDKRGGFPWPVEGKVLTSFGMQRHPQFGTMVFRRGIEIQAHEGQEVHAVGDGQVAFADWYKGYGKLLILDHGNGFYTLYGNLSRLRLTKGDRVVRGQVIGLAGETGSLKGSKLYFEIRRNGEAQDPLGLLAKR